MIHISINRHIINIKLPTINRLIVDKLKYSDTKTITIYIPNTIYNKINFFSNKYGGKFTISRYISLLINRYAENIQINEPIFHSFNNLANFCLQSEYLANKLNRKNLIKWKL